MNHINRINHNNDINLLYYFYYTNDSDYFNYVSTPDMLRRLGSAYVLAHDVLASPHRMRSAPVGRGTRQRTRSAGHGARPETHARRGPVGGAGLRRPVAGHLAIPFRSDKEAYQILWHPWRGCPCRPRSPPCPLLQCPWRSCRGSPRRVTTLPRPRRPPPCA